MTIKKIIGYAHRMERVVATRNEAVTGSTGYIDQERELRRLMGDCPILEGSDHYGRGFLAISVEKSCALDDGDPHVSLETLVFFQRYIDSNLVACALDGHLLIGDTVVDAAGEMIIHDLLETGRSDRVDDWCGINRHLTFRIVPPAGRAIDQPLVDEYADRMSRGDWSE